MPHRDDTVKRRRYTIEEEVDEKDRTIVLFGIPAVSRGVSMCLLIAYIITMILAFILLIVALALPSWIEGTENGVDREIGLFSQTENGNELDDTRLWDSPSSLLEGSGALFVIGMIALALAILLALFAACLISGWLVLSAKLCNVFANFLFIIAVLLLALGLEDLDDTCPSGTSFQCGLNCTDPRDSFEPFILCAPYTIGAAIHVMGAALIILFLASCCGFWVRG
ncbi:uncharacterized protein MONBRDRAFT_29958 [Monosiga brevicollis MX1]|uniref:Uncharacterized protein n=1 Tax=Monosiga brevicollis TaxID=81824 RepID=A9VCL5_MONBE|nr:uncharacterized protein MONBRDRAFT_29958 [Monosiga brevicollis MX1]EDQ84705.1 predicted protein [Monosiga brevicollis MX1]|eukprot:XP_001750491.1 hypothetical protein [Monosiga brevicollis MX1]